MYSLEQLKEVVKNTKGYDIANLVDANGNERFIEGDVNIEETTGMSKVYGKWSLSGTHLMFVLVLNIANATAYTSKTIANIPLPAWVLDKLEPLFGTTIIPYTTFKAFKNDGTTNQNIDMRLVKITGGVAIGSYSFTASDDRSVRVEFDLIVD